MTLTSSRRFGATLSFLLLATMATAASETPRGTLATERLESNILRENRTGLDTHRTIKVYLPPGYADSARSYPVVYFCHNMNWSAEQVFANGNMARQLERAFANRVLPEIIMVAADYSAPGMGSLYENSPVTGRWLDHTVQEVVPLIDRKYRTLAHRDSRALVGDFMGGRGVLKLAMTHGDVFSVAYALHPVATGTGHLPYRYIDLDWNRIHAAQSVAELAGSGREHIFTAITQAFLPNLNRPPLYCDFFVERENGQPKISPDNVRRLHKAFHLDETLDEAAPMLRTLRGLAFDWARHDSNPAHVESNQAFTRKLVDLGVEHEAEEYLGNPWDKNWTENGRFYTRVLPFLNQHLVFRRDS